jgi:hypothetical protein
MKNAIYFLLLFGMSHGLMAQDSGLQTVKGRIIDKDAQQPIIGATIIIKDSDPIIGTTSDLNGYFAINKVPVGRVDLQISFVGYYPVARNQILVLSAKETFLQIEMEESVTAMEELVITADQDKTAINNDMALVSARGFNIEQTMRFAVH